MDRRGAMTDTLLVAIDGWWSPLHYFLAGFPFIYQINTVVVGEW